MSILPHKQEPHPSHLTNSLDSVLIVPNFPIRVIDHHSRILACEKRKEEGLLYAVQTAASILPALIHRILRLTINQDVAFSCGVDVIMPNLSLSAYGRAEGVIVGVFTLREGRGNCEEEQSSHIGVSPMPACLPSGVGSRIGVAVQCGTHFHFFYLFILFSPSLFE